MPGARRAGGLLLGHFRLLLNFHVLYLLVRGGETLLGSSPPRSVRFYLPPADLGCLSSGDALHAVDGFVSDEFHAGVEEVQALRVGRLFAGLCQVNNGFYAHLGHFDRVLLCCRADYTGLDVVDTCAAAVNGDDQNVFFLARGLQSLESTCGSGLIDRVDNVDIGVLGQQGLHCGTSTVFGA